MLAQRLFFGALLIAGVVLIAWGDIRLARAAQPAFLGLDLSRGSLIPLAVFLLATFGAIESLRLAAAAGHRPVAGMVLACVACLHAAVTLVPGIPGRGGLQEPVVLIVALGFLAIGCVQVARRRTAGSLGDMASSVLVIIYMGILPAFITTMRTCGPGSRGVWFVVLFVAVVKLTDIGAYFTGLAAGRTKLIPEISPGKTVEGLAGGLAAGCAAAVVLSCTLPWPADVQPGWVQALGFGGTVSLVGQVGDLVESMLKRDAQAKDSGRLIPSFGGMLDLLDSPVFAAPVGYLLIRMWLA